MRERVYGRWRENAFLRRCGHRQPDQGFYVNKGGLIATNDGKLFQRLEEARL